MNLSPENAEKIERISSEYKSWIENLTKDEVKAIQKYTLNSHDKEKPNRFFERLNRAMRGVYNGSDLEMLQNYGKILSNAICKQTISYPIVCYRNLDRNLVASVSLGTIFKFNQFVSTSIIESQALKKDFKYVIVVPAGSKGAYIGNLSKYKEQFEFLLDVSCEYRLIEKGEKRFTLEVVV